MVKLIDIGIIVLSSGIFLLCYLLFMRKEKYHQLNRAYLLLSLTFSSLLPFVRFSIPSIAEQPLIPNTQIFLTTVTETATIPFGTISYVTGVVLFFLFFLLKLFKVLRQINGKHCIEMNGLKVIDKPEQKVPFSFFRFVVVDFTTFQPDELDMVLRHEAAHAKQWHTLDLLFVEVMGVVCWFNPFVWAYKSVLKVVHEYAADASVINSKVPRDDYLDLILKQIRRQNRLAPVHSFSAAAVKSRIRMMMVAVHGRHRWLRYLTVIPVLAFVAVANSLLASEVNIPPFMEIPVIKEVVNNPSSEPSVDEVFVDNHNDRKEVGHQAKTSSEPAESDPQLEVLKSQPWLSTGYGDPVDFYEEKPSSKIEVQYTVKVVGDDPQIYYITTPRVAGKAYVHEEDSPKAYRITTPEDQ